MNGFINYFEIICKCFNYCDNSKKCKENRGIFFVFFLFLVSYEVWIVMICWYLN